MKCEKRIFQKDTTMSLLQRLVRHDGGATAIEYGLIAGLIAVAIIVAITLLGTDLSGLFTGVAGKVTSATPT